MIIIKLYIIYDAEDKIFAITEYKYHAIRFILQTNNTLYHYKKYNMSEKKFNHYMIKYDDIILYEYENFIIREKELKYVKDLIETTKYQLKYTMECIQNINQDCIMSPNEHEILGNASHIIKKYIKKKRINDFIGIKSFIRDIYSKKSIRDSIYDLTNYFV